MRTDFLVAALITIVSSAPVHADVVISTDATQNMSCSSGICAPTATDAVLNVTDLENLLVSGDVSVVTTNGSVQANNIDITAAFSWSSSSLLTLDAYQSLSVNAAITVQSLAGLTVRTNDGGKKGTFLFGTGGNFTFANLSSSLSINGHSYTLVNSLPGLASAIAGNPSGSYALANSYDASRDGTYSASPVPTYLTGTVDGLGNTISNLSVVFVSERHGTRIGGTFSVVQQGGAIENLNLANFNLQAHGWDVGGLAGYNDGTLSGDHVQGSVTGGGKGVFVGGLVGLSVGTIEHSSADDDVVGGSGAAGGLVGYNRADSAKGGTITLSWAGGTVTCGGKKGVCYGGGLVGYNEGYPYPSLISQSFATAAVSEKGTGVYYPGAGGLVGFNQTTTVIKNSYATGSVSGEYAGGLDDWDEYDEGYPPPEFTNSYATGKVTTTGDGSTGGFVCNAAGPFYKHNYWDTTTSKVSSGSCFGDVSGVKGLSSNKLRSGLPAGFDPSIWAEDANINNGFPYLIANPPPK